MTGRDITAWFAARTGGGNKRNRRVAIARRLLIALWRYAIQGVVPAGARLRPCATRAQQKRSSRGDGFVTPGVDA